MAKHPLTRPQLLVVLLVAVGLGGWLLWQRHRSSEAVERIERAERRIEASLPRGGGVAATSVAEEDGPPTVRLVIEALPDTGGAHRQFWVRIGGTAWELGVPRGAMDDAAWEAWAKRSETYWEEIVGTLRLARTEYDDDAPVVGQVVVGGSGDREPPPHGLVMRALDAFLRAGLAEVSFEAGPPHQPSADD